MGVMSPVDRVGRLVAAELQLDEERSEIFPLTGP